MLLESKIGSNCKYRYFSIEEKNQESILLNNEELELGTFKQDKNSFIILGIRKIILR